MQANQRVGFAAHDITLGRIRSIDSDLALDKATWGWNSPLANFPLQLVPIPA